MQTDDIIEKSTSKKSVPIKKRKVILFKSKKAMQLSPLHFQLSMPTRKFEEKKDDIRNRLFAFEGHLFLSETREKRPEYDVSGLFLPHHPSIQKIITLL